MDIDSTSTSTKTIDESSLARFPQQRETNLPRGTTPFLLVVAGPNGSGKSTFIAQLVAGARELSEVSMPERYLNPDDFARAIDPMEPDRARIEAGRAILRQRSELLAARADFAIETTLSGNSEVRLLKDARACGYRIAIVYVATESPRPNVLRIALRRVEQHRHVDARDVIRRYHRSLAQVASSTKIANISYIFDNTSTTFVELLTLRNGVIVEELKTTRWCERALSDELATFRQDGPGVIGDPY